MGDPLERTWEKQVTEEGEFARRATTFHGVVGHADFPVESGRYHVYVSLACPWAHRVLITRHLKGLADHISVDVVDHHLGPEGWTFDTKNPGATGDRVNGFSLLREAYEQTMPGYAGAVTVPVLWDKLGGRIVNNESSEIIRMLNEAFQPLARHPQDLYPAPLRSQIDALNDWVYNDVNDGVYRAGFARSQHAYDVAIERLFTALDRLENMVAQRRFLVGNAITEADIRLLPTLLRFDHVYHTHFKCNVKRLVDYPALWAYTRELYALPCVRETTDFEHIRKHYYGSHESLNPYGIVARGPELDWTPPEDRALGFNTTQLA